MYRSVSESTDMFCALKMAPPTPHRQQAKAEHNPPTLAGPFYTHEQCSLGSDLVSYCASSVDGTSSTGPAASGRFRADRLRATFAETRTTWLGASLGRLCYHPWRAPAQRAWLSDPSVPLIPVQTSGHMDVGNWRGKNDRVV